jgi:propionyl-CoA carboxylase beta chain
MFVTGPDVVKTVTNEIVTAEELGGARCTPPSLDRRRRLRQRRRGAAADAPADRLPARSKPREAVPEWPSFDDSEPRRMSLDTLIPDNPNKPYDMKELILKVVDEGDFFEIQPPCRKNIVTGFARIEGRTVGIVANQPMVLAGVLDIDASPQGRALRALLRCLQHPDRHLRRRAGLPAGHGAGIRRPHQARRQAAVRLCRGTVPKVTVITRKAYGGAYDVMAPSTCAAT